MESNLQKPSSSSSPKPDNERPDGNFLGLGIQIVAQVGVGVLAGVWLDSRLHSSPAFTIGLSVLMIIVALYQFIRQSFKN